MGCNQSRYTIVTRSRQLHQICRVYQAKWQLPSTHMELLLPWWSPDKQSFWGVAQSSQEDLKESSPKCLQVGRNLEEGTSRNGGIYKTVGGRRKSPSKEEESSDEETIKRITVEFTGGNRSLDQLKSLCCVIWLLATYWSSLTLFRHSDKIA